MFGIQPQFPRGKRLRLHGLFVACAALLASAAITSAAYDIYWTKDTLIYGSAADGMNPTVVFDGTGIMAGRAIDVAVTDTHIYWTDNGDPANPTASQIWRAERNGDNAAPFILPNALYTAPQFLEIDEANNKLYFTSWTEGLFSADLDTGENLDLIVKPFSNHTGIALLNSNEMALITAADDSNAIWVVNLTTKTASEQFFGAGSHQTYGLVADTENNLLYRTDHATGERTIRQISINPTSDVPLYTAAGRPLGIDLSPSGKYLVFVDGTNLTALNLETGMASPLVHGLAAFGVALAADPAPREDIVFMDDFNSYTPDETVPVERWTRVLQGPQEEGTDRGTITVLTDEENIFHQGTSNQYIQIRVTPALTTINLGALDLYAVGEGPELITFSMEFIEPDDSPFSSASRLGIRLYSGSGFSTTLDQLDVRDLRDAGLFQKNDHVRVDYLVNTTDSDVEYSRDDGTGSWILPANSAAAWAYDPAVGPGDEPGIVGLELTTANPLTGFMFATFSTNSIVLNIDNVKVYNEIVVGRDLPELQAPESGFAAWQADKFNAEELADPAISGPDAAPAGDGISNLMKYALGLEPHTPARDRLPIAGFIGDQLALVYQRPAGIDDVEYVVEVSTDLVTWDSGELLTAEEIIAEGGIETVTVRAIDFPGDPSSRGFMRLRALQK